MSDTARARAGSVNEHQVLQFWGMWEEALVGDKQCAQILGRQLHGDTPFKTVRSGRTTCVEQFVVDGGALGFTRFQSRGGAKTKSLRGRDSQPIRLTAGKAQQFVLNRASLPMSIFACSTTCSQQAEYPRTAISGHLADLNECPV